MNTLHYHPPDSYDLLKSRITHIVFFQKEKAGPLGALRKHIGNNFLFFLFNFKFKFFHSLFSPYAALLKRQKNEIEELHAKLQVGLIFISSFFIASAPTLFPPEYVEEFQNCFDRAPEIPFDEIQPILREELGRPIDSVYEYVDPTPIASASIAQVHGARLRGSQEDVVIKILKPGIEDILVADLNFIYVVARLLEFLNPELSRASLVGIVQDIRESMLEEVDFKKEAANIEAFRRYLEAMGLIRQAIAPKVYYQCSSHRVLTMQRLYGVPLTDLDSISSLVASPETSLITALNMWFGSLLACETFHADVHAGNLWLLRDGRIGFLDFGIVGRISPKTWSAMEIFLASIGNEEYESMASALIEMGATSTDVDSKAFARDLEKIFSSIKASIIHKSLHVYWKIEVNVGTFRTTLFHAPKTKKKNNSTSIKLMLFFDYFINF
ncbi:hypothetical protein UlMin_042425 [Ulmus minor]